MTYQDVLDALDSILEKLRGNNSELCEKLGIEIDDPYINGEEVDSEENDSEDLGSDDGDVEVVDVEIDNEDNVDNEQLVDDEDDSSVNEAEAGKDAPEKGLISQAADKVSDAWNKTTKWATDNPGKAVAAAAGTGLATALIGDMVFGDDEEDESTQQSFNESDDDSFTDSLGNTKNNVVDALKSAGKTALKPVDGLARVSKYAADKAGKGMDYLVSSIPSNSAKVEEPTATSGQTSDEGEQSAVSMTSDEIEKIEVGDGNPEEHPAEPKTDGKPEEKKPEAEEPKNDDEIVIDDIGDGNGEEGDKGEKVNSPSDNDVFGVQKAADTVKSGAITGGALIGAGLLGSALLNRRRRRRRS